MTKDSLHLSSRDCPNHCLIYDLHPTSFQSKGGWICARPTSEMQTLEFPSKLIGEALALNVCITFEGKIGQISTVPTMYRFQSFHFFPINLGPGWFASFAIGLMLLSMEPPSYLGKYPQTNESVYHGKIWEDMGRYGKNWEDMGRYGKPVCCLFGFAQLLW